MLGINKVTLIGTVGKDPESKEVKSGPICSFTLATNENRINKTTGEKEKTTQWHSIKCFNKVAEIAQEYVKKGQKIYIDGKLSTGKFTDENGAEKFYCHIWANQVQVIDYGKTASQNQQNNKQETSDFDVPF